MFKFIKNLFTKKKQFTLDDLDLSKRVELRLVKAKKGPCAYMVYFYHPITKELWPMPNRKAPFYSKWTLLKKGHIHSENKDLLRVSYYESWDLKYRFETVNHLRIYFESLERKYNELHEIKK